MTENVVNSILLAVVVIACTLHLNTMTRQTPECERWGFILTAAGSFGSALAYWWPLWMDAHPDTMQNIGLALVALSMMRGRLHHLIARIRGWDGTDRRSRI